MIIGIMGAMNQEIELLKNFINITSTVNHGMRDYFIGTLADREVVLTYSKCGKVSAASAAVTLIEKFNVDLIIFTGLAGAASNDLFVGDIVIADKLIQHDVDASPLSMFKRFEIPLMDKTYFEVDESYINLAKRSASFYLENTMSSEISETILDEFFIKKPKIIVGTIASGDKFIANKKLIQNLSKDIDNLMCVEMEGAALAQVCYEHSISFVVIRVISDLADEVANISFEKFVTSTGSYFTCGIVNQLIHDLD